MDLPKDYATVIQLWREAWTRLRAHTVISEPNKIHIINCHLEVTLSQQEAERFNFYPLNCLSIRFHY
jgi:hypothetical protein